MAGVGILRTEGFNNYSVELSPFVDGLMAVAASQYFGIVGNGRLYVARQTQGAQPVVVRAFDTQDGLFDCCWNEANEHQIATASGDGSVKIWDLNSSDGFPIKNFHEHKQECASVDWNLVSKQTLVSASWDGTIKCWDPNMPRALVTFADHAGSVYNCQWSPRHANLCISCSADGFVKVFDTTQPRSVSSVKAHDGEVLAVDWNKYNEFMFATGSVDRTIRTFDLRRPQQPLTVLAGHEFAVRRLKFSPHDANLIASCSYDMSLNLWRIDREDALWMRCQHHTEFVMGLDFNLFRPNSIASASWDEHVCIFDPNLGPPPKIPPIPKRAGMPPSALKQSA